MIPRGQGARSDGAVQKQPYAPNWLNQGYQEFRLHRVTESVGKNRNLAQLVEIVQIGEAMIVGMIKSTFAIKGNQPGTVDAMYSCKQVI